MRYYPVSLDLQGKPVTVVGGGAVAERKVISLLACGARLTLIAPVLTPKLLLMSRAGAVRHRARRWRAGDLNGAFLVIAATDDPELNARIGEEAGRMSRLFNSVDDPDRSNFIAPAVVARGDLILTVSTSGKSPALARRIRLELERSFGADYGRFLKLMGQVRKQVQARIPSMARRRRILQRLAASDLLSLLRRGKSVQAHKRIRKVVGLKDLTLKV